LDIIEKFSEFNKFDFDAVGLLLVRSDEESLAEGINVEVDEDDPGRFSLLFGGSHCLDV
jgi:hypothetical protein